MTTASPPLNSRSINASSASTITSAESILQRSEAAREPFLAFRDKIKEDRETLLKIGITQIEVANHLQSIFIECNRQLTLAKASQAAQLILLGDTSEEIKKECEQNVNTCRASVAQLEKERDAFSYSISLYDRNIPFRILGTSHSAKKEPLYANADKLSSFDEKAEYIRFLVLDEIHANQRELLENGGQLLEVERRFHPIRVRGLRSRVVMRSDYVIRNAQTKKAMIVSDDHILNIRNHGYFGGNTGSLRYIDPTHMIQVLTGT